MKESGHKTPSNSCTNTALYNHGLNECTSKSDASVEENMDKLKPNLKIWKELVCYDKWRPWWCSVRLKEINKDPPITNFQYTPFFFAHSDKNLYF